MKKTDRMDWQSALAGAVLLLLMLFGLWQMSVAVTRPGVLDVPRSWEDIRIGKTAGTLEKSIERAMPQRPDLIMVANAIRYWLTNGSDAQVRIGKEGWLFLTEEVQHPVDGMSTLQERISLLAEVNQRLQARGITLLVLPVPDKARVYSEFLATQTSADVQRRYEVALQALHEQGVASVDLLAAMQAATGPTLYYRSDTHWNQEGARLAANAVAQWVASRQLLAGTEHFVTRSDGEKHERIGDLLRMMGLESAPSWLRPAGDWEITATTEVMASEGDADDLFGEEQVAAVLVGTSYSRRGNFHGYLQEALASTVLNAARDGGGFLQSAQDYFSDDAFNMTPPSVLIWELPERFLTQPLTDERDWVNRVLPMTASQTSLSE